MIKKIGKISEDEKQGFQNLHCCLTMEIELFKKNAIFSYDLQHREYRLAVPNGGALLKYCIFCGKNLPISLRGPWFNILEQEYGLEDPLGDDKSKIPKEFLADEWWKIRGL